MKRVESTPFKLLLLPLVPALALGIVEVARHITLPTTVSTVDTPPEPVDRCGGYACAMPA